MEAVIIGQYRVTGLIGRGGMGAVYAAEHTLIGRSVAIKILLPELSRAQDIVMRFFNEARAAASVRHPGIIEIHDFGWTPEGAAYIVMEHLQGETLSRRLRRGTLPWQVALTVVRQIAGALGAAHAKGIVHRDLKPENIFLVPDPEVPGGERIKILDFGIAKLAGEGSIAAHVTRTGAVMGTPTYMAPEQCRGVPIDHRADLYAVGCILFELCTGGPPFVGEGSGDVLAAHIHLPPPTLVASRVTAPAHVEHLLQRLLAKLPAQRVQTADELIREIDVIHTERNIAPALTPTPGRAPSASAASLTTLSSAAATSDRLSGTERRWQGRSIAVLFCAVAAILIVIVALVARGGDDATRAMSAAATPAVQEAPSSAAQPATPSTPPSSAAQPATPSTLPSSATQQATASGPPLSTTQHTTPSAPPSSLPPPPPPATPSALPSSAPPPPPEAPSGAASSAPQPEAPSGAASSAPQPETPSGAASSAPPRTTSPSPPSSSPQQPRLPTPSSSPTPRATSPSAPSSAAQQATSSAPSSSPPRTTSSAPSSSPPRTTSSAPSSAGPREAGPRPTIDVRVDSVPSGAQVVLGGMVLGRTPFRGALQRRNGEVAFVLRLPGYTDKTVTARGDQAVNARVTLTRLPPGPSRAPERDESVNPFAQ